MAAEDGMWDGVGYMRAKKRKLREQFQYLPEDNTSDIFDRVTIYVNGWTDPNADELKRLIHAHGGRYEYNLYGDSNVTHTIATNLPNAKVRNLGDACVCTPDWILDSIAMGKRLPVEDYLLYSRRGCNQRRLAFEKVAPSTSAQAVADPGPTATYTATMNAPSLPTNGDGEGEAATDPVTVAQHPELIRGAAVELLTGKTKPFNQHNSSTAAQAGFVSDYYTNSRLHYLSTWSTELRQLTSKMLPQASQKWPKLSPGLSLRGHGQRLVVHIDLDCFFVSVSIRDKPHLRGKPVAVCHAKLPQKGNSDCRRDENSTGQIDAHPTPLPVPYGASSTLLEGSSIPRHLLRSMSDVASCSYEARAAGLRNGMCVGEALQLCPELQLVPYEFDKYHEVSKALYTLLMSYSAVIEPVSCDEAYIELTDYVESVDQAERIIQELRDEIQCSTGCTVSAGMAENMLLARMATRKAKPDRQYYLPREEVASFLVCQKVHDLPGVGRSTSIKLREMGVEMCGELQGLTLSKLQLEFGAKTGRTLYQFGRGEDSRQLKLSSERKSLSVDLNFGIRLTTLLEAENLLKNLSAELEKRANEAKLLGGAITLKLMIRKPEAPTETRKYLGHGACNTVSRTCRLLEPTGEATEICHSVSRLLKQIGPPPCDIRGVGLQLSRLVAVEGAEGGGGGVRSSMSDLRKMMTAKPQNSERTLPSLLPPLPNLSSTPASNAVPLPPPPRTPNLDDTFLVDLPPASQLDCSVLCALPSNLRDKILSGYAKAGQTVTLCNPGAIGRERRGTAAGVYTLLGRAAPSPETAGCSPGKGGTRRGRRGGGRRGRGRGRGRGGGSPQGYCQRQGIRTKTSASKTSALSTSPGKQVLLTNMREAAVYETDEFAQQLSISEAPFPPKVNEEDERGEIIIEDQADFLSVFRSYLRDWVHGSLTGPVESDVTEVTTYCTNLCKDNLEPVFIVLQWFRRFVVSLNIPVWVTVFNTLLANVQSCVCRECNGTLPIENI